MKYDQIDAVNWSTLRHILRSPAHYRHELTKVQESTDAMTLGTCVHMAILEPRKFLSQVACWTGGRRAGKEWDAFKEAHPLNLREDDYQRCLEMAASVRAHTEAGGLLDGCQAEQAITWTRDGIKCKGRIDAMKPGVIVDVKTTRNASPAAFGRQAHGLGSIGQASWYVDGMGGNSRFYFIAVENVAPYPVAVYRLTEGQLEAGREMNHAALQIYRDCLDRNDWPSYPSGDLQMPAWASSDTEGSYDGEGLIGLSAE